MTREEAIKQLKDNRVLCINSETEPFAIAYDMAIKSLEQEPVLDKIRAEIVELDVFYDNDYFSRNKNLMLKRNEVLQIIDKYKAESEE